MLCYVHCGPLIAKVEAVGIALSVSHATASRVLCFRWLPCGRHELKHGVHHYQCMLRFHSVCYACCAEQSVVSLVFSMETARVGERETSTTYMVFVSGLRVLCMLCFKGPQGNNSVWCTCAVYAVLQRVLLFVGTTRVDATQIASPRICACVWFVYAMHAVLQRASR